MVPTLLSSGLLGAATLLAAPLPANQPPRALVTSAVAVTAAPSPAPSTSPLKVAQSTQAERDRERAREARERALERAQNEREQAQERAQRERDQARERAEREREKAQEKAERERERAEKAREREQRNRGYVEVDGERQTRTFQVGGNGSLFLNNISGDVTVTAGSGSEVRVEAFPHGKGRTHDEARKQLENVQVTMQESGGRVEVRTYHRGRESRAWVDFTVVVPAGIRAELQSVSGDITVTGVKGEVRAETVSGDVKATQLSRVALLKSLSGDVTLTGGESDALVLATVSGDVLATNIKARSLEVNSVSGNSVVRHCACDRAQAHSVSGDLEFNGRLAKGGRYELKTHSGDLRFYHLGSGFDLSASTFSGDLRLDQPAATATRGGDRGFMPGRTVRTTVGSGGAVVDLTTFSGDITVAKGQ